MLYLLFSVVIVHYDDNLDPRPPAVRNSGVRTGEKEDAFIIIIMNVHIVSGGIVVSTEG